MSEANTERRSRSREVQSLEQQAMASFSLIPFPVPIQLLRLDIGFHTARNLIANAPAFSQASAQVGRGDSDRRDRDGQEPMRARSEVGQARRVDLLHAGTVDHDDRGQLRDPGRLAPRDEIGQAISADQEE